LKPDDYLTLEDVLREAVHLGLELSERTFRYYNVLGLLPRPVKLPSGDARVHYYPREILTRLQDIRKLQNEGYSLKQIKSYFAVVPAEPKPTAAVERRQAPADALLESFARQLPKQAAERFLARTVGQGEDAFREAALDYYAELLGMLGNRGSARTAVAEAVAALTPLELERLLKPLRDWRDREAGKRRAGGLSLTRRLRQLALDKLAGQSVPAFELEAYARALAGLARRARQQEKDADPVVQRVATRLGASLERLAAACRLEDPAAVLGELEGAERGIADLDQLLRLYSRL